MRGKLFSRFCHRKLGPMYEPTPQHLNRWIAFMLAPRSSVDVMPQTYTTCPLFGRIGYVTFRLGRVMIPQYVKILPGLRTKKDMLRILRRSPLKPDYVLHTHRLDQDFLTFMQYYSGKSGPEIDLEKLRKKMDKLNNRNASRSGRALTRGDIRPELIRRIHEQESLIYRYFALPKDGKTMPTAQIKTTKAA